MTTTATATGAATTVVRALRTAADDDAVRRLFRATLGFGSPVPFPLPGLARYEGLALDWYLGPGRRDAAVLDRGGEVVGYLLVCTDAVGFERVQRDEAIRFTAWAAPRIALRRLPEPARTFWRLRLVDGYHAWRHGRRRATTTGAATTTTTDGATANATTTGATTGATATGATATGATATGATATGATATGATATGATATTATTTTASATTTSLDGLAHVHLNLDPSAKATRRTLDLLTHADERTAAAGLPGWFGEINAVVGRRASALERVVGEVVDRQPNRTFSWLAGKPVERLTVVRRQPLLISNRC